MKEIYMIFQEKDIWRIQNPTHPPSCILNDNCLTRIASYMNILINIADLPNLGRLNCQPLTKSCNGVVNNYGQGRVDRGGGRNDGGIKL